MTFVEISSKPDNRYSEQGFKSLLFDLYFLANADYLVCTFSSNICRLAYELLLANKIHDGDHHNEIYDEKSYSYSIDMPYYHISDANYYRMAILAHKEKDNVDNHLRRGDMFHRRMVTGLDYDDYKLNGFSFGKNVRTAKFGTFPSYKLKIVY